MKAGIPARRPPAQPAPLRLSQRRRYTVYAVGVLLWLSGVLWLLFHYFLQRKGPFGPEPSPLEPWLLRVHGALAFAALWTFGMAWSAHVVAGWSTGRHRFSGGGAVGLLVALVLSGYLLYYLIDDKWRYWASIAHWGLGLGLPLVFAVHILQGRRRSRSRITQSRSPLRLSMPELGTVASNLVDPCRH